MESERIESEIIITEKNIKKLFAGGRRFDVFAPGAKALPASAAQGWAKASLKNSEKLKKLLRENIYPLPVVCKDEVIWGFPLLEAALESGIEEISVREIIIADNTPGETAGYRRDKYLLKASLICEERKESYAWSEKEKLFNLVKDIFGDNYNEETAEISELIQSGSLFSESVRSYIALPGILKQYTDRGMTDLKTAIACSNIPQPALQKAEKYLAGLSFSRRRLMLVNISEIIKRDNAASADSLALIESLLSSKDPFSQAEALRYPQLTACLKQFEDFKTSLLKGSGIKLDPPPFFEGEDFKVEFTFRSRKSLERKIEKLQKLGENSDDIFRLL